jgi:hypothetical protein
MKKKPRGRKSSDTVSLKEKKEGLFGEMMPFLIRLQR